MTKTLTLQIDDDDQSVNLTSGNVNIIEMLGMAEFIRLSAESKLHKTWDRQDSEEPTADSEESNK